MVWTSGKAWMAWAVMGAGFVGMAGWTWGIWPDPLIDSGRELYVAWRIAEGGEHLYRDIAWFNGPLSAYFNAGIFAAFGAGLWTLVWANLAIAAVATGLVWHVTRSVGGLAAGTVAGLGFVVIVAFSVYDELYVTTWAMPYSHEATHGAALGLGAMAAVLGFVRSGRARWAAVAGVLVGLVFLTKVEIFAGAAAGVVTGLAAGCVVHGRWGALGGFAMGALVGPVVAWGLLARVMDGGVAWEGMTFAWRQLGNERLHELEFYRRVLGVHDLGESVRTIGMWTAGWAAFGGAVVGAAWVNARLGGFGRMGRIVFVAGVVVVGLGTWGAVGWGHFMRPAGVAMAALGVWVVVGFVRAMGRGEREEAIVYGQRLAVIVLGGALLGKMAMNVHLVHYGFVLAVVAAAVMVAAAVGWLPEYLARRGMDGALARGAAVAACAVVMVIYVEYAADHVSGRRVWVGSGADAFRATPEAAGELSKALAQVERQVAAGRSIVVMPEGVMINYLSRRVNPTGFVSFLPPEVVMFGEERMVGALAGSEPDFVQVVYRDTSEYGLPRFGADYGRAIAGWVEREYVRVELVGRSPLEAGGDGVVLLRRAGGK